jgi:hypothetical protein
MKTWTVQPTTVERLTTENITLDLIFEIPAVKTSTIPTTTKGNGDYSNLNMENTTNISGSRDGSQG